MQTRTRWIGMAAALAVLAGAAGVWGMGDAKRLEAPSPAVTITSEEQFAEQVEQARGVVLVDFWATWCPPCKYMNPIVADVAQQHAGRLKVAKVDVDHNRELAARFKVGGIPTFVIFKDGEAVDLRVGAMKKDDFAAWVKKHTGS